MIKSQAAGRTFWSLGLLGLKLPNFGNFSSVITSAMEIFCDQFCLLASSFVRSLTSGQQARREGERGGGSFPGPRDVLGALRRSKILKTLFHPTDPRWLLSKLKYA